MKIGRYKLVRGSELRNNAFLACGQDKKNAEAWVADLDQNDIDYRWVTYTKENIRRGNLAEIKRQHNTWCLVQASDYEPIENDYGEVSP